jgi:hypothetical protein
MAKRKINPKQIDDIYIFEVTAQFLLDHAEDNILPAWWCTKKLKSSLKTTLEELKMATSIPFVDRSVEATSEMVDQQITGSMLAEKNMRLSLKFDKLSEDEKFRFQCQYENLLSQFNLYID